MFFQKSLQAGRDYTNIKYAAEVAGMCESNKSTTSSTLSSVSVSKPGQHISNTNLHGLGQHLLLSSLHRQHETVSIIKPPIFSRFVSDNKYPSKQTIPVSVETDSEFLSSQNYENLSLKDKPSNVNNMSNQAPPLPPRK